MEYRRLGRSGLKTSEVALGSWLTYGTVTERDAAIACVHRAYELGINHFDCANMYGAKPHAAEDVLAEALKEFPRSSYILTTKAYWPVGPGPNDRGLSRKHIMEQVHESLRRLRTDYLDIMYCHRYDPETPVDETMRALDDLVTQGKVLYIGVSEWTAAQLMEGVATNRELGLDPITASQPVYNMLTRRIEAEELPVAAREGIGIVAFSPLAQGVLTGKYRSGQIPSGSRAADPTVGKFVNRYLTEANLAKVEKLRAIAQNRGISLAQLALAWILRQPAVSSVLVGATRTEQVDDNAGASGIKLSGAELQAIEDALNG
ncbi:MAG: aldo/keto reductase family protein [Bacillota bacterium]